MKKNLFNLFSMFLVLATFAMISCDKGGKDLLTLSASDVTGVSAVLNGEVSVTLSSNVFFEYGTSKSYGSEIAAVQNPVIGEDVVVFATISNLEPTTTYHFRVKVVNADGEFYGKNKSFTTTSETDPFLASTTQEKKSVLIEMFTGVRCGYCPDGAVRAKAVADNNPGKVAVIGVHTGSYGAPQAGWANFNTDFGAALATKALVSGFPAGQVNRVLCSELGVPPQRTGGYAMSRGSYATAAGVILLQDAPVNIGSKAAYNPSTRELRVKVDIYYVSEVSGSQSINVALVQDGIVAKQSGGGDSYVHNNVLRHLLTGQWGDVISTTGQAAGSKIRKTYTYTVPEDYNGATIPPGGGAVVPENLRVIVFVANGETNVLNARVVTIP